MKRCLLDLDGVCVAFNEGACHFHKVKNPYDDPANLGKYEISELVGMPRASFYNPLDEDFWANLQPTIECFEIVRHLESIFGKDKICLLTSPIITPGCHEGKLRWIRKYLPDYARRNLIGASKEFAASPDAWLIDDAERNTDKFALWGGNAFLIPRPWNSLHHLRNSVTQSLKAYGP